MLSEPKQDRLKFFHFKNEDSDIPKPRVAIICHDPGLPFDHPTIDFDHDSRSAADAADTCGRRFCFAASVRASMRRCLRPTRRCDASSRRRDACFDSVSLFSPLHFVTLSTLAAHFCVAATSDFRVMPGRLLSLQGGVATLTAGAPVHAVSTSSLRSRSG